MRKKRKYALVLSGGGFKGAFQLGAINHLARNWRQIDPSGNPMHFDIIAGVSVGALNGAMLAMGQLGELNKMWAQIAENGVEEIYTSPLIDTQHQGEEVALKLDLDALQKQFLPDFEIKANLFESLGLLLSPKKKKRFIRATIERAIATAKANLGKFRSLADNEPLQEKLQKLLDRDAIQNTRFQCGFVGLENGQYFSISQDEFKTNQDFIQGVLASTVMPIIWAPVQEINFQGHQLKQAVDGGIRNISPLGDVIQHINQDKDPNTEYTIIIINCSNGEIEPKDFSKANIFQIALRTLQEITLSEIFNNDLEHFTRINDILRQVKAIQPKLDLFKMNSQTNAPTNTRLKLFKSIIIQPKGNTLGDTLVANKEIINRRKSHGSTQADEAVQEYLAQQAAAMPIA